MFPPLDHTRSKSQNANVIYQMKVTARRVRRRILLRKGEVNRKMVNTEEGLKRRIERNRLEENTNANATAVMKLTAMTIGNHLARMFMKTSLTIATCKILVSLSAKPTSVSWMNLRQ